MDDDDIVTTDPTYEDDPPPLDEPVQVATTSQGKSRGEYVKFGGLVVVLLFVVALVSWTAPLVGRIVPAVLGLDAPAATLTVPLEESDPLEPDAAPRTDAAPAADEVVGSDEEMPATAVEEDEADFPAEPIPTPRIHLVQPGQNLTMIARQYGVTVEAIVAANNLTRPDWIEAGMTLVIP
jgi:LysM repeat protein